MIKIKDDWYYEFDGVQYTLIHIYEKEMTAFGSREKTGEVREVQETIGYYSTMAAMLLKLTTLLAKEKIDTGEIKTIEQHITVLKTIKEEIESIVSPF